MPHCENPITNPDGQSYCAWDMTPYDGPPSEASTAGYVAGPELLSDPFGWGLDNWPLLMMVVGTLLFLRQNIRVLDPNTTLIIERLGQYNRSVHAGIAVKIPLVEKAAGTLDLTQKSMDFKVKERTSDRYEVTVLLEVIYEPREGSHVTAFYKRHGLRELVKILVASQAKPKIASMTLTDVLTNRDVIRAELQETVTSRLREMGYDVLEIAVTDIVLDRKTIYAYEKALEEHLRASR